MKGLVERLRHGCGGTVRDTNLMNEAADQIERLRAALRAISDWGDGQTTSERSMNRIAAAAINDKEPSE